jgi:hypothetical protein
VAEKIKEEDARASVDELTSGLVDMAHHNGILPPMRQIEEYAKQITQQTVNETERAPAPLPMPDAQKARVKLDEMMENQMQEDAFGKSKAIHREWDQAKFEKIQARQESVPMSEVIEAELARNRLMMLLEMVVDQSGKHYRYPDWASRIKNQFILVRDMGLSNGESYERATNVATDAILTILDDSNRLFGNWRDLKDKQLIWIPQN